MDALGGVVGDEFGGGVIGVEFDLVYGGDDGRGGVGEEEFEVFDAEVGDADVADFAGGGEFLHFLPAFTRRISFCLFFDLEVVKVSMYHQAGTYQVLIKFQSGRCLDVSLGSVELGQCIRYRST